LFESKPSVFLERYHAHVNKEYIDCFPANDERCRVYIESIEARKDEPSNKRLIRNRRFMAMQKLKDDGDYFSLEKMRERAPFLFDTMIGDHLHDNEKIQLRPTVVRPEGSFSNLMEQLDESQRISERRKRHFEEFEGCINVDRTDTFLNHVSERFDDNDFDMEFDSSDDEGRQAEIKRKKCVSRYIVDKELPEQILPESRPSTSNNLADDTMKQLSELKMAEEIHPEDPKTSAEEIDMDSNGIEHGALIDEFRTFMEQRFLSGDDKNFVDYKEIDNDESAINLSKWNDQEREDAYFADSES